MIYVGTYKGIPIWKRTKRKFSCNSKKTVQYSPDSETKDATLKPQGENHEPILRQNQG